MATCDPPWSKVDRPAEPGQIGEPAALETDPKKARGSGPAATSAGDEQPPAGKPGRDDDESDDSGIGIEITFED